LFFIEITAFELILYVSSAFAKHITNVRVFYGIKDTCSISVKCLPIGLNTNQNILFTKFTVVNYVYQRLVLKGDTYMYHLIIIQYCYI